MTLTADKLLTPEELAERWQMADKNGKPTAIWRMAREGRIPCVRLGKHIRFQLEAIERFEKEGGFDL